MLVLLILSGLDNLSQASSTYQVAVTKKCPESWQNYKQARNEVTAALRKAKESYFERMLGEVKKSSTYWKLINKATSRIVHKKSMGPLRRNDGSLALIDKEKAQLMHSYFTTIGENLINTLPTIIDTSQAENTNHDCHLQPNCPREDQQVKDL